MKQYCCSIILSVILLTSLFTLNPAFAIEPAVEIHGYVESGVPDQYLVVVKVCAGSEERFESPQIYLSSDVVTKIPIVINAIVGKNSCTYRDYTIKANDPVSITAGFSDTGESDSAKIKELENEIAELKSLIMEKTKKSDKKNVKDTQTKSVKSKTTSNVKVKNAAKKANLLDAIIITEKEIPDSRDWKVKTFQGRKGLQFNNINMDSLSGIKNRVEQTFAIDSKIISSKDPFTFYSLVEIYKNENKVPTTSPTSMMPCNDCIEEVKIGKADCFRIKENYEFGFYKDATELLCRIKNAEVYVYGLKVDSLTTNENMETAIMKLLIEKVGKAKL